jgi:soluble lytic murein transglycosylase
MKRRIAKLAVFLVCFVLLGTSVVVLSREIALAKAKPEKNDVIERIVAYLKGKNVEIGDDNLKTVVHSVYDESQQVDLDYRLALAVIKVESNFRQDAVSKKGARGLFQIKPSLARYIAKDAGVAWNGNECLHEPEKNVKLGVYHLSRLMDDFKSLPTALHAYNAGANSMKTRSAKTVPKTAFTKQVMKEYQKNISILPDAETPEK